MSFTQRSTATETLETSTLVPREPQQARGKARYEILLDAAESILAEQNGSEVTLLAAASRASVPLASVYHYFPSNMAMLGLTLTSSPNALNKVE